MVFHPDKGGNLELMTELNKQYEKWQTYAKSENSKPNYDSYGRPIVDPEFGLNLNHYKMRCESLERELYQSRYLTSQYLSQINKNQFSISCLEKHIEDLKRENFELKELYKRIIDKKKVPRKKTATKRKRRIIKEKAA